MGNLDEDENNDNGLVLQVEEGSNEVKTAAQDPENISQQWILVPEVLFPLNEHFFIVSKKDKSRVLDISGGGKGGKRMGGSRSCRRCRRRCAVGR